VTLPVQNVAQDPFINFESKIFTDQLARGAIFGVLLTALVFCLLYILFKRVGRQKILTRKIRGQKVTTAPLLVEAIEEHNEKARERRNAHHTKDVKIGDVPYPFMTERNHTIVSGTTGMGKTVLISSLIDTIRARGDKAVILDNEGTYVKRYFNPETDVVLNPLDARTANWDPFLDAQSPEDWSTLAASIFKSPPGDDPYWVESARSIFQWTAITLSLRPETSNVRSLLGYLFGETAALKELLRGTPAYSHFSSGEGQSNRVDSLKSVIANEVTPLILLTSVAADFSLRDWLVPPEEKAAARAKQEARAVASAAAAQAPQEAPSKASLPLRTARAVRTFADDFVTAPKLWLRDIRSSFERKAPEPEHPEREVEQGGFLFLTAPEDQLDSLRKLLSFWCELAVITLLSRPEDPDQRCVWLIFDEFPSLPKIEKSPKDHSACASTVDAWCWGSSNCPRSRNDTVPKRRERSWECARRKLPSARPTLKRRNSCQSSSEGSRFAQLRRTSATGRTPCETASIWSPRKKCSPFCCRKISSTWRCFTASFESQTYAPKLMAAPSRSLRS